MEQRVNVVLHLVLVSYPWYMFIPGTSSLSCIQHTGETQVLAEVLNMRGSGVVTVGVLASTHKPLVPGGSDGWQTTVLLYNSDDSDASTDTDDVTVRVKGLPPQKGEFEFVFFLPTFFSE